METAWLDWVTRDHARITAVPAVLARHEKAAQSGILIGFRDEAEYKTAIGLAFDSLTPVGKVML